MSKKKNVNFLNHLFILFVSYLGYVIDKQGLHMDKSKMDAIVTCTQTFKYNGVKKCLWSSKFLWRSMD